MKKITKLIILVSILTCGLFASCNKPQAEEKPTLTGTAWQHKSSQTYEDGVSIYTRTVKFITDNTVYYEWIDMFNGVLFDSSTKMGTYIYLHPKVYISMDDEDSFEATIKDEALIIDRGDGVVMTYYKL